MRIDRFQLANYSSFADTGMVELQPGINIIVGENNAGKSAILRSLYNLENFPHKSLDAYLPERLGVSRQTISVSLSGSDIETAWLRAPANHIYINFGATEPSAIQRLVNDTILSPNVVLVIKKSVNGEHVAFFPFSDITRTPQSPSALFTIQDGKIVYMQGNIGPDNSHVLVNTIWRDNVFMFDAQRFSLGRGGIEYPDRLNGSANNLPAVLNQLQGERTDVFRRLVAHVREIFSTIRNLSVRYTQQGDLEILVWPIDQQEHPELSVGLNNSGTGVAQAIAILTVAMTLREAVIVVDEISSFLHPAAAKTLLRILQTNYPQHQYIISTHSPEVLSASSPSTVHFIRKVGFESSVTPVDLNNLEDLRQVTGQLGISMTDVFAVERIIWVEGPTEELCFPYIYTQAVAPMPRSTMFVPVIATGDFSKTGTRLELVLEIYERLSRAATPLVKSVTFGFDLEELSDREKDDLLRRSAGNIHLLPRRHFECYLLDPSAIADLLVAHVPDLDLAEIRKQIEERLLELGGDKDFKAHKVFNGDPAEPLWLAKVDAAKLIKRVCSEVSGQRFEFAKKVHSLELLKSRMETDTGSADLAELIACVRELVDGSKDRPAAKPAS
ncbi:AAA family ATPase [Mesorhizobium sp. M1273]|uniref:AAA family ATPase n=1 Tax=Mesorhizobium sp. M1273 TaxID=2957075 RepID=UPI0033394D5F